MLSRRAYKPLCKSSALKALNGDWIALKQKLRLSVLPAHQRHEPTQIVQTWSSADGGKLFQIGLAVLIQYRRVTDSQPATRPPSQPASQTRCRSKYRAYAQVKIAKIMSWFISLGTSMLELVQLLSNDNVNRLTLKCHMPSRLVSK